MLSEPREWGKDRWDPAVLRIFPAAKYIFFFGSEDLNSLRWAVRL